MRGGLVQVALLTDRAHAAAMEPVRREAERVLGRASGRAERDRGADRAQDRLHSPAVRHRSAARLAAALLLPGREDASWPWPPARAAWANRPWR